ncbi:MULTISPECIES: LCP family protein [Brevibacillus]|uniref:Transcriptional regulator n=1 Tax=Brevibacillus parabrevis TaxID=54914 RepID=A0A4Y3PM66_BREPA|nr:MULTISPECIES: LCP family protein [Brevibacillus]MED1722375.1 LCP family protein [Brevibacillus parabrevis]RNB92126.1 LytR family transcriptional regulator [Brevibacillus parabrevis]GEB35632.1 transcriptional regulator [Brevibacillus parabrevis]HBZ79689.1 transcriptional regulator [Brevibacillus sp.]
MRIWKRVLLLMLVVIATTAGYYGYSFYEFAQNIQAPNVVTPAPPDGGAATKAAEIPEWDGQERVNILLMGVDRRGMKNNGLPRSDSMMLVSIDPASKRYDLFSILRDTYVDIPGNGSSRINSAIVDGGPELAMKTVSQFTGLPVDRYVITDFEGFKALIDAVGGVEIDVEKNMYYHDPTDKGVYDINLKKGVQQLDGNKALQYVRFRHDATSDYTRTERQRKLLAAVASQMKSGTSLIQLPSILKQVAPYIQTNISSMDMLKLSALGLKLDTMQPGNYQLPPMGMFRESHKAGAVLIPDVDQIQSFIQEKLEPPTETMQQEDNKTDDSTDSKDSTRM